MQSQSSIEEGKNIKKPQKAGIFEENGVLYVNGDEYIIRVTSALANSTRLFILKYIKEHESDVGEIADLIKQSKANASAQIKKLEEAGLIRTTYKPGQRGVKKITVSNVKQIVINLE
ncbi:MULTISPECIES: ArsR/SmtB family transcription factor [Fervidicoccus]|uniref:Transcriptional regulator, HTH-type n=3 Tax=Fervidicoccus fontis TaxID=683846 RepID=I0A063_FERFK|nr:ArsR family transcriptional regulator [Fervidicoccus fontis]AFH42370.1 transcriptional regulator, HTH-type [Fervidicoccus fontis Kam940]PMB76131.1 MAG: ArsR family transcriptional regulator [Fervidicoccus fontis]PMB77658.1 MAG: ArsR family transcriptional regulator [Fervidicoccus fontis]HEW64419.1 ArsR family transcriptional regulator [Fervidicoccus fontis]